MSAAAVDIGVCVIADEAIVLFVHFKLLFLCELDFVIIVVARNHRYGDIVLVKNGHVLVDRLPCKSLINAVRNICAYRVSREIIARKNDEIRFLFFDCRSDEVLGNGVEIRVVLKVGKLQNSEPSEAVKTKSRVGFLGRNADCKGREKHYGRHKN